MAQQEKFARIQAFLTSANQVVVYAPPDPEKQYALRYVKAAASTALLAAAVVAPIPAPAQEAGEVENIQSVYAKYIAHGQAEYRTSLEIDAADSGSKQAPEATINDEAKECVIRGIRPNYSALMGEADTPIMRTFIMIHEDLHCRISPYILSDPKERYAGKTDAMADAYAVLISESIADAMGILIIARRDGREAASDLLGRVRHIRLLTDESHDSRAALQIVSDILGLNDSPAMASDAAAFMAAVDAGVRGASLTFPRQIPPASMKKLTTDGFQKQVANIANGLRNAALAYEMGDIEKNKATFAAGGKVMPIQLPREVVSRTAGIDEPSRIFSTAKVATMGMIAFAHAHTGGMQNTLSNSWAWAQPTAKSGKGVYASGLRSVPASDEESDGQPEFAPR